MKTKTLLKIAAAVTIVITACIFVRFETGTVICVQKAENDWITASEPDYVLHWCSGFYIKKLNCNYFDYKTDRLGFSNDITDTYEYQIGNREYKIELITNYYLRSDIAAVRQFGIDHAGMREKFYRKQIEYFLTHATIQSQDDLKMTQIILAGYLKEEWDGRLPFLNFSVKAISIRDI